jgi:hypothetical protein
MYRKYDYHSQERTINQKISKALHHLKVKHKRFISHRVQQKMRGRHFSMPGSYP